jgi:hypothetical protein
MPETARAASEIASAVARRNVHAATQCNCQVTEVSAHTASLGMRIPCRLGRAGVSVAENDAIVDIIADRIRQRPTLRNLSEQGPRRISSLDPTVDSGDRLAIAWTAGCGAATLDFIHVQFQLCLSIKVAVATRQ